MTVITSTSNPAVKAARKLARRPGRQRAGAFLVEGPQAVREAVGLRTLFVAEDFDDHELVSNAAEAGAQVIVVTGEVLASVADTVTPQGLVGVAELPEPGLDQALQDCALAVVLWEAGEPGNVGTIIRSADAAGADAVICTAGSADPRNPKAVRASAGSLFHLPVVSGVDGHGALVACRARGLRLVAADAVGPVNHCDVDLAAPTALVFGNEAHGLPEPVLDVCDVVASLPIHDGVRRGYGGRAESLNLAATVAVFVYEAARQRGTAGRHASIAAGAGGHRP